MDDLVIVDTETTGFNISSDRVIEVGALKVLNGKITKTYSNLISIKGEVPEITTKITGITKKDLTTYGYSPKKVFSEIRSFIGKSTFVAHNVNFDYKFLNSEFSRLNIPELDNPKLCTIKFARKSNLPITNFKLITIKEFLGLDITSHRALNDVMVCYELLKQQSFFIS